MTTATVTTGPADGAARAEHHEVVVVGTGFSGLGLAIRLREAGVDDVVLLERGDDVGGTWRDNTYPGAACDVPSHLYSFSFAPNPRWTRSFSPQPEILDYLRGVAAHHGLTDRVRFATTATSAVYDEATARWIVTTDTGASYTARFLVSAAGPLSEPVVPDLPGLETFPGAVFHSARWDHDHDLVGERVAVVGTGASAIQFLPHVARDAGRTVLFQRTAPWVAPRLDISNDYYPALTRDDVEVVASGVREIRGSTVVAADGSRHDVDTLIFGTGFEVTTPPIAQRVRGRDGRLLADAWSDGMRAHLGACVDGFPNLFLMIGPNTGLGHTSMVFMMEAQMRYLVDAITTVRDRGLPAVEVRAEVVDAWDAEVQAGLEGTVWTAGGCASWYLDDSGRNSTLWPDFTFRFRQRTASFRLDEHHVIHPTGGLVPSPERGDERVPA